jgi:TRAP-type uncharacterized transport system fused permease subunit
MRLGMVNFVVPFLFVLNPTLILIGDPIDIAHDVTTAVVAVWMLAAVAEGWLYGVGKIGTVARIILLIGAAGMLKPGLYSDLFGAAVIASVYVLSWLLARNKARAA